MSIIFAVLFFAASGEVRADVKSYCQAYGAQVASSRIGGGTILTGENPKSISLDSWKSIAASAAEDCQAQYTAKPSVAETATAKVAVAVTAQPTEQHEAKLEPGSPEWNDYCSKKYNSFKPETGTYMSRSGKERRCVVSR